MGTQPEFRRESGGLTILEQVQKSEGKLPCEKSHRPYLIAVNQNYKLLVLFKPRCKLWSCPSCAETNKSLWAVRVYQGASNLTANGHRLYFLTLTSHEKTNKRSSVKYWPDAWKKLRQRAVEKAGGMQYVMIPEQHQDGRMHIHAIETAGLGKRWWKDNARACGLGFMADEQEIQEPARAAAYCTKYLTKSIAYQEWPKGFRRVRRSQAWPMPPGEELQGWDFRPLDKKRDLASLQAEWADDGYTVHEFDHRAAWTYIQEIQSMIEAFEARLDD